MNIRKKIIHIRSQLKVELNINCSLSVTEFSSFYNINDPG